MDPATRSGVGNPAFTPWRVEAYGKDRSTRPLSALSKGHAPGRFLASRTHAPLSPTPPMTLPLPPVLIIAKREWNREPVDSVLPCKFDRWNTAKKPLKRSVKREKNLRRHLDERRRLTHRHFEVRHLSSLQILSSKALRLRVSRCSSIAASFNRGM